MISICFIANYNKTYFFDAVAKVLLKRGISVYWITVNSSLNNFLVENYNTDSVLYINRTHINIPNQAVIDLKLNELLYGDRSLKYYKHDGFKFLTHIQKPIYDFIYNHNIKYVFGELTWAHELLIHRMTRNCKQLNCTYLNPHTIRIPNGRFAFFTDEYQSEIHNVTKADNFNSDSLFFNPKDGHIEKPDYLALNDQILKNARSLSSRFAMAKRFITAENIDPLDPTIIPERWLRFKKRVTEELNKEMSRFLKRDSLSEIPNNSFVFLALHKQPEASIDVIGRYQENQLQNIHDLWRALPQGWSIVIKEHTNAIGDRPLFFYKNLIQYPSIYIVDEKIDSHDIIKRSKLVVTVSGTVAYEAALLGIPSLTLGPTFFNSLTNCYNASGRTFRCINITEIAKLVNSKEDIDNFNTWLMSNSFNGLITDPVSNIECLEPSNISQVANAFFETIEE